PRDCLMCSPLAAIRPPSLHDALPISLRCVVLPPGEQEKTLARFSELMSALAALGASRDATVIALGGGVIGDLAGFAAACWMRGIDRKSTRLNSSHVQISYAVFCLKDK